MPRAPTADFLHREPDSRPGSAPVSGAPASLSRISDASQAAALDAELRLIAEQAQMLTQASGAAIALRQGDWMVCRARAGATAPELGSQLDVQSGLSGESVRTRKTLICSDTESDSRVNLDVCRFLGIRSIAVLPICLGQEVVGVFEVFSPQPGIFSGNEVTALESMRDLVMSVIRPAPQAPVPATSPSLAKASVPENPPAKLPISPPAAKAAPPVAPLANAVAPPVLPPVKVAVSPVVAIPASPAPAAPKPEQAAMVPPPAPPVQHLDFRQEADDDLLCEIEPRPQEEGDSDLLIRAFELVKGGHSAESSVPSNAFENWDPDDDLLCEIDMRNGREPLSSLEASEEDHELSAFTPAPARPVEKTVPRKLMLAGLVAVVLGLVWLGWCNHAQQLAHNSIAANVVAHAAPAVPPAPKPVEPAPSQMAEAAAPPQITDSTDNRSAETTLPAKIPSDPAPRASATRPAAPATTHLAAEPAVVEKTRKNSPAAGSPRNAPGRINIASVSPPAPQPSSSRPVAPASDQHPGSPPASLTSTESRSAGQATSLPVDPPASEPPATKSAGQTPGTAAPSRSGQLSLSQAVVTAAPETGSDSKLSPDAIRLLRSSAEAGDGNAQLALAVRYTNGEGVKQSYAEALKWFKRAKEQGVEADQGKAAEAWSKVQQWAQGTEKR